MRTEGKRNMGDARYRMRREWEGRGKNCKGGILCKRIGSERRKMRVDLDIWWGRCRKAEEKERMERDTKDDDYRKT